MCLRLYLLKLLESSRVSELSHLQNEIRASVDRTVLLIISITSKSVKRAILPSMQFKEIKCRLSTLALLSQKGNAQQINDQADRMENDAQDEMARDSKTLGIGNNWDAQAN